MRRSARCRARRGNPSTSSQSQTARPDAGSVTSLVAICILVAAGFCAVATAPSARAGDAAGAAAASSDGGDASRTAEGRSLFNQYCAHCHAPNAVSPDPPKDLRRLKLRYGERMGEVFHFTVTHGRPDKGMPNWQGVLDDATLSTIFVFLQSVQTEP
jgi:mono/diheme cytochrome c family protein